MLQDLFLQATAAKSAVVACVVLAAVLWPGSVPRAVACSEYQHVWQTITQSSAESVSTPTLAILLERVAPLVASGATTTWGVNVVDAASMSAVLDDALAGATNLASAASMTWRWCPTTPMFSWQMASNTTTTRWLPPDLAGMVFVELVEPSQGDFFWVDHGGAPFTMFRIGHIESLRARVIAVDSAANVRLVDELPIHTVVAVDIMAPVHPVLGALWIRRVSRTRPPLPRTREWLLSPPPAQKEMIFSMPIDQERWYWGASEPVTAPGVRR